MVIRASYDIAPTQQVAYQEAFAFAGLWRPDFTAGGMARADREAGLNGSADAGEEFISLIETP